MIGQSPRAGWPIRNHQHIAWRRAKQSVGNTAYQETLEKEPAARSDRQQLRTFVLEHGADRGCRRFATHDHASTVGGEAGIRDDGLYSLPGVFLGAALITPDRRLIEADRFHHGVV
jgi:hypothetical protein